MRSFVILLSFLFINAFVDCYAFSVKVGVSKNWSLSNKISANAKKSRDVILQAYDLDSALITRISNLQVDVAIVPLTLYKNVFERQSQLSKFVINSVVGEEAVGILTLKNCDKNTKNETLYADEFSPEFKWFIRNQSNKFAIKKISYYEILHLMESGTLDCQTGIVGSLRFLDKIKNSDRFKFEKKGQLLFLLLVEEHFFKNRYDEIKAIKKALFPEAKENGTSPNIFEELRKQVFDYNFSGTKFQLERLNEIIRLY